MHANSKEVTLHLQRKLLENSFCDQVIYKKK